MEAAARWVRIHLAMLLLAVVLVSPALGTTTCPPVDENTPDPALEEKYYYSNVLVMGKVTEKYPTSQNPRVYTAEMEVYCVYKGQDVPAVINITNAGESADLCFTTEFKVGMSHLAYLKKHSDGRLTPTYPQDPEGYKDEMIFICGVNITYPVGKNGQLKKPPEDVTCGQKKPEEEYEYEYEDEAANVTCFSFKPKTEPTYKTEKATEEEMVDDKDKDKEAENVKVTDEQEGEDGDDENGTGLLRMSLLVLALVPVVGLVFS